MTLVIGHRGASADHPENTIEAFVGAREQGADWVELDVRRTRDGVLVVHHDPAVQDGPVIAESVAADLPGSVPTLTAALEACAPMGVNIEIKNTPEEPGFDASREIAARTLEAAVAVRAVGVRSGGPLSISSFDLLAIERVRELQPAMTTGWLVFSCDDPVDAVAVCVAGGYDAVHPFDLFVDGATVRRSHGAGVAVNVWTVDAVERIEELVRMGVDAVITNRPAVARSIVDRLERTPDA